MTYTGTARLEADDLDDFDLTLEEGFAVDNLDIGFPAIRAVVEPNTDRDGDDDRTRLFGARAVVLNGTIVPTDDLSRQAVLDRLAAFLVPTRRPWLVYELEAGSGERRIRLRGDQHGRPITRPGSLRVSCGWRGPDGVQEASDETELDITAIGPEEGVTFDISFDVDFGPGDRWGIGDIELAGTLPTWPIIELYGPCIDPRIENETNGTRLLFDDVELYTGESLVIDTRARTITKAGANVYGLLDIPGSRWIRLDPGVSTIRYFPAHADVGAHAVIRARSTWL